MEAPTTTLFRPARIVALALIALAVAGLAFLHFSSGSSAVSVPKGAHAGQLTLEPCKYGTEDGSYAADCGTLVVQENRHDRSSRLIALPVKRIRALSSHPREPVFRLQGGPGLTNLDFPDASRYAGDRDVVLVGYRGVEGSSVLDCPEAVSAMKHARDFIGRAFFDAYANGLSTCAHRLQADGVDLAGYSLPERVDDLEAARRALGYGRIDLLSESAGTRTALIYGWRSWWASTRPGTSSGTRRRTTSRFASTRPCAPATSGAAHGRTTSRPRSRRPRTTCPTAGASCGSSGATRSWARSSG
jgi:hypothetical protein